MLLVKTKLSESKIHNAGLGCFAEEFIPRGTKIWEFNPDIDRVYDNKDFDSMSLLELEFLKKYSYKNMDLYYLCVDNGRFINHSENPNTLEDNKVQATYASKDIHPGDEIVSDYRRFGVTVADHLFNCEGLTFISDFDVPYTC